MINLSDVSTTLFVPMGGRIYSSINFPDIFYDEKALSLKSQIPEEMLNDKLQSQYTFMASAIRCRNIDNIINDFLQEFPDGNIVELGCGLETTYYRADNGKAKWFLLDLDNVIEFRKTLLPEENRINYIKASVFDTKWMDDLCLKIGDEPILFVASGLFHYFERNKIIDLLKNLKRFKNSYIVFDVVSKLGMSATRRYMKQLNKASATMYFYCDDANILIESIGHDSKLIFEDDFYKNINTNKMKLITKISIAVSNLLHMVKIVKIKL